MQTWPTPYSCKLMEAGIISYEDSGAGIAYLTKQTIDKIAPSIIGRPVVIRHQKVTPENVQEVAVGYVTGVHFEAADAWFYVDFLITSDKVQPIDKDGCVVFKAPDGQILDGISGAYDVTNTADGGVWHDIQFDAEILDGSFTHLALVVNPRYEETNKIRETNFMLVNGKVAKQTVENSTKTHCPKCDKEVALMVEEGKTTCQECGGPVKHPKDNAKKFKDESGIEIEFVDQRIEANGDLWLIDADGKEIGPFDGPTKRHKKNSKGGSAMKNLFKIFRKLANGKEEEVDKVVVIDGKEVPLKELVHTYEAEEAEKAKKAELDLRMAKDDEEVEIGDKKVKVGDLKNGYLAKMAKKNSKADEDKEAEDKKAKEDEAKNEKESEDKDKADEEAKNAKDEEDKKAAEEKEAEEKKNSKADGEKFFKQVENAGKGPAVEEYVGGPMTRDERAEMGRSRYGSKQEK